MGLYWACPSIIWARRSRAVGYLETWFLLPPVASSERAGCRIGVRKPSARVHVAWLFAPEVAPRACGLQEV